MADWAAICCALDFSPSSRVVLEKAAGLARRLQAGLTLLHVYQPRAASPELLLERYEKASLELEKAIGQCRAEAERLSGRPVRTLVLSGSPAREIVRLARDGTFDLVVIGTHGETGLARVVLGSVAEKVVREASCPVLVVRQTPAPGGGGA